MHAHKKKNDPSVWEMSTVYYFQNKIKWQLTKFILTFKWRINSTINIVWQIGDDKKSLLLKFLRLKDNLFFQFSKIEYKPHKYIENNAL